MHDSPTQPSVVFAHGKESGPWGTKIQHLGAIAETLGFVVESPDYQGIDDPRERLAHLQALAPTGAPLVLAGSSMGGYVSAMACAHLAPAALFLMAPALYMPGYPGEPDGCPRDTVVVHGWDDDIVPLSTASLAFARKRRAALHVVADGHRLADSLTLVGGLFRSQLERALTRTAR